MDKTLDNIIKKHVILTCLTALAVICMMITITYGLYQTNHKNTADQEIAIGDFDVNLTSNSGQITLADLNPGDTGNTSYTFTTSNSGDYTVAYSVYLTDNTTIFLSNSSNATTYSGYTQITEENYAYINYSLDGRVARSLSEAYDSTTGKMTIITGRLEPSDSQNHTITFSISSNAPNSLQGSILALNITMDAAADDEAGVDTILKLVTGSPSNSTDVITKTAPSGATCTNTFAYDGTVDNSLRYVGADPCNYVTFNGETAGWRIVGIMNNVDDGTGNKETRIKLVRATSLGSYSVDSSANSVNSGRGINDWTQADLKNELNGDYLNTSLSANTTWYNAINNGKTAAYDYTKGLNAAAQELIGNTKWHLGGYTSTMTNFMPHTLYNLERGSSVLGNPVGTCEDGACPRATEWTGKVALIYATDYIFATAGGAGASRSDCIYNLSPYNDSAAETWVNPSYTDCRNNDYLYTTNWLWTISPNSESTSYSYRINTGYVGRNYTYGAGQIYPSVYLVADAIISSGNGSSQSPYVIS